MSSLLGITKRLVTSVSTWCVPCSSHAVFQTPLACLLDASFAVVSHFQKAASCHGNRNSASLNLIVLIYKRRMCVCVHMRTQSLSHVQLVATPWTVVCQASLSMGFFTQEYWSGLSFQLQIFPTQGSDLHLLHILHWKVDSLPLHHLEYYSAIKRTK